MCEAVDAKTADRFQPWRQKLADGEAKKRLRAGANYPTDGDIHPLRFCKEIQNFMSREGILTVDGQDILNFGRQYADFVPRPPPQFRAVRHDGRRVAVRGRRQGSPSPRRKSSACMAMAPLG